MFRLAILGVILNCAWSQAFSPPNFKQLYPRPQNDVSSYSIDEHITENFITQPVNHFDHQDNRTFSMVNIEVASPTTKLSCIFASYKFSCLYQQRYFQNAEHFRSGGPVFLMIGGESEIRPENISPGYHIYDLAKEFNGLLLYIEHRFYGKSVPISEFPSENLQYLYVDQVLADLAHFVQTITSDEALNASGGVIVVGGSYAGSLATWFRRKYPHLVNGAWASSAPLLAKLDFVGYAEAVGNVIRDFGGEECYSTLDRAYKALDIVVENQDIETLNKLFNVCNDFDIQNKLDVWNFIAISRDIFQSNVQAGR